MSNKTAIHEILSHSNSYRVEKKKKKKKISVAVGGGAAEWQMTQKWKSFFNY